MFERFTERARHVVVLGQEAAKGAEQDRIDSVALLLGLLGEAEGLGAKILGTLKVDEAGVRKAWKSELTGETAPVRRDGQLPFTTDADRIFELALREALNLGHNYIGTVHILLGLVRQDCDAAVMLHDTFGVDAEPVRNEVMRVLSGSKVVPNHRRVELESDLKFRSFSHAWATGVIAAALFGAEAFSVNVTSGAPEMTVRFGPRSYRLIVEELQ